MHHEYQIIQLKILARIQQARREKRDLKEVFFHKFVTFGGGYPRSEETVEPLFPVMLSGQGRRKRWWAGIHIHDMRKLWSPNEFLYSVDALLHSTAHLTTMTSPRLWTWLCFPCISIDMFYQLFITPNITSVPICDVITFTFYWHSPNILTTFAISCPSTLVLGKEMKTINTSNDISEPQGDSSKLFICEQCNYSCKKASVLKTHMQTRV